MPDWMEISKQERWASKEIEECCIQCVNSLKLSVALAHSSHVKCETVIRINHGAPNGPEKQSHWHQHNPRGTENEH